MNSVSTWMWGEKVNSRFASSLIPRDDQTAIITTVVFYLREWEERHNLHCMVNVINGTRHRGSLILPTRHFIIFVGNFMRIRTTKLLNIIFIYSALKITTKYKLHRTGQINRGLALKII